MNPLPKILELIHEEVIFIDPKLLSSAAEIVKHATGRKPTEKALMVILEGLEEAGYVKIYNLPDNIKTIKKVKHGN